MRHGGGGEHHGIKHKTTALALGSELQRLECDKATKKNIYFFISLNAVRINVYLLCETV
jgi:hypothetical protein